MGTFQFCQNWKRNNQASIKLFSKVFEWIIIFGLLIGVFYFVKDVWNQYQSKKSGVKSSIKNQDNITPPTVTICFNPLAKLSILEKYKMNMTEFLGSQKGTPTHIYEEGFFKIGRDFDLTLSLLLLKYEKTYEKPAIDDIFEVAEFHTIYSGRCYKVTPKVTFEVLENFAFYVKMKGNLAEGDKPMIQFHVTSEPNSHGVIIGQWFDGKDFMIEANSNDSTSFYEISVETTRLQKLKHKCDQEGNSMQCASKRYFII